ncbi:CBS domain-containing protein [Membranicola marinus]|uniref:CBS domain-containing protein n=1 Tax=Membranihabitans marinus TaxID=1227546 RepID=A0A953HP08_9BACT|nr:CBS domain-containing protein [Membranihabitans marinus]MBY5958133.1 CBS domain-containing protein [Membranihabitans marinus]
MIAKQIISNNFKNVSISNTVDEALKILDGNKTRHLPLIKSKAFLTIVDEDTLRISQPGTTLRELTKKGVRVFVRAQDHMLEAAKKMANEGLTIMPVLDEEDTYLGVITIEKLYEEIISTYDLGSEGSLLVLEVPQQDFYLSEMIRILEMEKVHIFSVLVSTGNYPVIEITLKTDIKDINTVLQTLERYSYKVKAYYEDDSYSHQLKDRYESLMSYLNV